MPASKTVADIMETEPLTVSPGDDVRTVIEKLREHELPGLPVVEDDGKVVGIVSDDDLVLEEEQASLHLPHFLDIMGGVVFLEPLSGFENKLRKAFAAKVEDMMTAKVVTVGAADSVHDAAQKITDYGHNRLPVVDADGKLVGIVTRLDILRALSG